MDYEYVVEVVDYCGRVIDHRQFQDSNTAYHEYRRLCDEYSGNIDVYVTLVEPE